jgi:CheY-like chemotaxis protein
MRDNLPILLVEDDVVDHMLVKRAFKNLDITNPLIIFTNGEEALEHLRDKSNPTPCIIIIDLNMPKMNGIEFLKIIKEDRVLKIIPVIVLTTSKEEQDKTECFKLGVAGYMIKPVEYVKFVELMDTMNKYWTFSELPL